MAQKQNEKKVSQPTTEKTKAVEKVVSQETQTPQAQAPDYKALFEAEALKYKKLQGRFTTLNETSKEQKALITSLEDEVAQLQADAEQKQVIMEHMQRDYINMTSALGSKNEQFNTLVDAVKPLISGISNLVVLAEKSVDNAITQHEHYDQFVRKTIAKGGAE